MDASTRPRTLPGLLARLLWLRRDLGVLAVLAAALGAVIVVACPGPRMSAATFNIRNFPENPRQVAGAFATIEQLGVPIVAVQEITDPARFAEEAARALGPDWRAEFGLDGPPPDRALLPGLLFDGERYVLDYALRHRATLVEGRGRQTLEVRLLASRGPSLRVFVVHLKSGGANVGTRQRQLDALAPLVRRANQGRDTVLVLGDFNATGQADAAALARFADQAGLRWTTRELPCTAYWQPDGKCQGSALDHVFSSQAARQAAARGPCEAVGCEPGEQCPIFYDEVSDHCPVTVEF